MFGYNGKILHVDLTEGKTWIDEHNTAWYRTYMGGRNVALYYLLKEVPAGADPFAPENVLVFATSVITGAPVPGTSRFTVAAKSPLTGTFGEAQAGGWWGPELKWAGYDAVVIHGKAKKPVFLWIHDTQVEIRDAEALWAKPPVKPLPPFERNWATAKSEWLESVKQERIWFDLHA